MKWATLLSYNETGNDCTEGAPFPTGPYLVADSFLSWTP